MKPNYNDFGLSLSMGPLLRAEVESQLLQDLAQYGIVSSGLRFDWSDSAIEGRCATYLDGSVDCFSGIQLYDESDQLAATGWLEFIVEPELDCVLFYWEFLTVYRNDSRITYKNKPGVPPHIVQPIPPTLRSKYGC